MASPSSTYNPIPLTSSLPTTNTANPSSSSSSKPPVAKLPVKRKKPPPPSATPKPTGDTQHSPPALPAPTPPLPVKAEDLDLIDDDDEEDDDHTPFADPTDPNAPMGIRTSSLAAFKYNRLWSEQDEIRFLRALIQSVSDGYRFPRDMPIFYDRFNGSMGHCYTRTQFSEKLRRLKKKFRLVSARLRRKPMDFTLKTPHEQVIYELSKRLWGGNSGPIAVISNDSANREAEFATDGFEEDRDEVGDMKLENDDYDDNIPPPPAPLPIPISISAPQSVAREEGIPIPIGGAPVVVAQDTVLSRITRGTVMDALDRSVRETRMVLLGNLESCGTGGTATKGRRYQRDLKKEWAQQQIAEFDILAKRLKLIAENAVLNPTGLGS